MFAIVNIKTGKWLYGTDFRYSPPRQRTSHNKMKTYEDEMEARWDFNYRRCGKDYRVVCLETVKIKRVLERTLDKPK